MTKDDATTKMELINECSMRFAEDKDFRLLVRTIMYERNND
jgi:hypothetical protein